MLVALFAVLSIAAAGGLRFALPLLVISLLYRDLWTQVPLLSHISPYVALPILITWSCLEILGTKNPTGQRILQIVQLMCSPTIGAILGIAVARLTQGPVLLMGIVGGTLALLVQLLQVGWFFRLGGLPWWVILGQDILCVILTVLALQAPKQGALIALLLVWLAVRSSRDWRNFYLRRHRNRPPSDNSH